MDDLPLPRQTDLAYSFYSMCVYAQFGNRYCLPDQVPPRVISLLFLKDWSSYLHTMTRQRESYAQNIAEYMKHFKS